MKPFAGGFRDRETLSYLREESGVHESAAGIGSQLRAQGNQAPRCQSITAGRASITTRDFTAEFSSAAARRCSPPQDLRRRRHHPISGHSASASRASATSTAGNMLDMRSCRPADLEDFGAIQR